MGENGFCLLFALGMGDMKACFISLLETPVNLAQGDVESGY
jgi:hypothetical protein